MRSNPMKHPERRKAFDESLAALRKAFPDAPVDWVRDQARRSARRIAVPKKAERPRRRVNVAQTYRAPTRAERNEQHRAKMAEKKRGR